MGRSIPRRLDHPLLEAGEAATGVVAGAAQTGILTNRHAAIIFGQGLNGEGERRELEQ